MSWLNRFFEQDEIIEGVGDNLQEALDDLAAKQAQMDMSGKELTKVEIVFPDGTLEINVDEIGW